MEEESCGLCMGESEYFHQLVVQLSWLERGSNKPKVLGSSPRSTIGSFSSFFLSSLTHQIQSVALLMVDLSLILSILIQHYCYDMLHYTQSNEDLLIFMIILLYYDLIFCMIIVVGTYKCIIVWLSSFDLLSAYCELSVNNHRRIVVEYIYHVQVEST